MSKNIDRDTGHLEGMVDDVVNQGAQNQASRQEAGRPISTYSDTDKTFARKMLEEKARRKIAADDLFGAGKDPGRSPDYVRDYIKGKRVLNLDIESVNGTVVQAAAMYHKAGDKISRPDAGDPNFFNEWSRGDGTPINWDNRRNSIVTHQPGTDRLINDKFIGGQQSEEDFVRKLHGFITEQSQGQPIYLQGSKVGDSDLPQIQRLFHKYKLPPIKIQEVFDTTRMAKKLWGKGGLPGQGRVKNPDKSGKFNVGFGQQELAPIVPEMPISLQPHNADWDVFENAHIGDAMLKTPKERVDTLLNASKKNSAHIANLEQMGPQTNPVQEQKRQDSLAYSKKRQQQIQDLHTVFQSQIPDQPMNGLFAKGFQQTLAAMTPKQQLERRERIMQRLANRAANPRPGKANTIDNTPPAPVNKPITNIHPSLGGGAANVPPINNNPEPEPELGPPVVLKDDTTKKGGNPKIIAIVREFKEIETRHSTVYNNAKSVDEKFEIVKKWSESLIFLAQDLQNLIEDLVQKGDMESANIAQNLLAKIKARERFIFGLWAHSNQNNSWGSDIIDKGDVPSNIPSHFNPPKPSGSATSGPTVGSSTTNNNQQQQTLPVAGAAGGPPNGPPTNTNTSPPPDNVPPVPLKGPAGGKADPILKDFVDKFKKIEIEYSGRYNSAKTMMDKDIILGIWEQALQDLLDSMRPKIEALKDGDLLKEQLLALYQTIRKRLRLLVDLDTNSYVADQNGAIKRNVPNEINTKFKPQSGGPASSVNQNNPPVGGGSSNPPVGGGSSNPPVGGGSNPPPGGPPPGGPPPGGPPPGGPPPGGPPPGGPPPGGGNNPASIQKQIKDLSDKKAAVSAALSRVTNIIDPITRDSTAKHYIAELQKIIAECDTLLRGNTI
jgi:hypothetical protein